jgi:tyrosyl-tRNA synthetase
MTIRVHGVKEFNSAIEASEILFGKGTTETLKNLDEKTLLSVFDGVPMFEMDRNSLNEGINIIDLVAEKTNVLASKSEARRTLKENALSINKTKITEDYICNDSDLLNNKYILIQKGKKNYYLIIVK